LYLQVSVDGTQIASRYFAAYGQVSGAVSATFPVDRVNRSVSCYYQESYYGTWGERTGTFSRRSPTNLVIVGDTGNIVHDFGNYERRIDYEARDSNYGNRPYDYNGTPIGESYSLPPVNTPDNSCNIVGIQRGTNAVVNSLGQFWDNYSTLGTAIPACASRPSCILRSVQTIQIESPTYAFRHDVTWRCTGVEVSPFP
jgi:hypothetical protein